jgi:hypothetical protein
MTDVNEADLGVTVLAEIEFEETGDNEENPSAIRKDLHDMINHLER